MEQEFPVRWKGPQFKEPRGTAKREKEGRRKTVEAKERKDKAEVRTRDKHCRFPLCGCRKSKRVMHVSHSTHKGMGGNPDGTCSHPATMVLLCADRHNGSMYCLHANTIRWRELTPEGANGPIAWDTPATHKNGRVHEWIEVARESAVQVLEPLSPQQAIILAELAKMIC